MAKQFYVYILTNSTNSILYIGVTSNIIKRIWEHKNSVVAGFTSKYKISKLVYYEVIESSYEAIKREKQLKNWHREWKMNLIKEENPKFKDLHEEIV